MTQIVWPDTLPHLTEIVFQGGHGWLLGRPGIPGRLVQVAGGGGLCVRLDSIVVISAKESGHV